MFKASAGLGGGNAVRVKLGKLAGRRMQHGSGVNVGIVKSARYPTEVIGGKKVTRPPTVASVAFWNEFGTKRAPARPFMRNSYQQYLQDPRVKALLQRTLGAKSPTLSREAAEMLGLLLQGIMREQIRSPKIAPNAPATIAIKTKGKGGNTTPLIDTGLLRRSIDYKVT